MEGVSERMLRLHDGVFAGLRGQESVVFVLGRHIGSCASDSAAFRQGLAQLIAGSSVRPHWQLCERRSNTQTWISAADCQPPAIVEAF